MIAACPSHAHRPPVENRAEANVTALVLVKGYPSLIPELMWNTSRPESSCCARGALAYSLVHTAIRNLLNEEVKTS